MSKILLLSAGTRPESKNNKAAGIVNSYLSELDISCNLYDDFYENVPFKHISHFGSIRRE